jgi:hypothetical protein
MKKLIATIGARLLHPEEPRLDRHLVALLGSPGVFGSPHVSSYAGPRGPFGLLRRLRFPGSLDFSRITTADRALTLSRQGKLARVILLPAVLGGSMEAEANAAYVPPEVVPVHQRLTATLERYFKEGRIDHLSVDPEYKGKSLVPTRIRVEAGKEGRVGAFTTVIGIW